MAILAALLLPLSAGNAQEFAMVEVPSMAALSIDQAQAEVDRLQRLPQGRAGGSSHRPHSIRGLGACEAAAEAGAQSLSELRRADGHRQDQRRRKAQTEKLQIYVAEARFVLGKPPVGSTSPGMSPSPISSDSTRRSSTRVIAPGEIMPVKHPELPHLRHPGRDWCAANMQGICTQSRYKFEGRLPAAISLANKLRERIAGRSSTMSSSRASCGSCRRRTATLPP